MEVISKQKKGKVLKCHRCGHFWPYKGNNPFVCSCPHCKTTVSVNKKNTLPVGKKLKNRFNLQ